MKLCLIRHGETDYNRENRMQGRRNIALSARGLQEAGDLGLALKTAGIKPQKIFSSPQKRAHDTAIHLNFQVPVITDDAFSARNLGELEGLTKPEIADLFPGVFEKLIHWDFYPPGGDESLGDLFRRADSRIAALRKTESEPMFVVTHSGVLEALVRGWLHLSPGQSLPFPLKNAGALLFRWCDAQVPATDGQNPLRGRALGVDPKSSTKCSTDGTLFESASGQGSGTWIIDRNIAVGSGSGTDHA